MAYTLIFDNTTNTLQNYMGSNGVTYLGNRFNTGSDMIGKIVNKCEIVMKYNTGTLTGTVYCYVVKADLSLIEIGSLDATTITSSDVTYTFTNDSNTYAMQNGDSIALEFTSVSGSYLSPYYSSNNVSNCDYAKKQTTWSYVDSISSEGKYYSLDAGPTPGGSTFMPPPIAHVRL